jgi:hypothetical protein
LKNEFWQELRKSESLCNALNDIEKTLPVNPPSINQVIALLNPVIAPVNPVIDDVILIHHYASRFRCNILIE